MTWILLAMMSKSFKNISYPESWMVCRALDLNSEVNIDLNFKEIVVTMKIAYSYTKVGTSVALELENDKLLFMKGYLNRFSFFIFKFGI